jgi:hypothetical protein
MPGQPFYLSTMQIASPGFLFHPILFVDPIFAMFDRPYSSSFLEINAARGPSVRCKESQAPPDLMN